MAFVDTLSAVSRKPALTLVWAVGCDILGFTRYSNGLLVVARSFLHLSCDQQQRRHCWPSMGHCATRNASHCSYFVGASSACKVGDWSICPGKSYLLPYFLA